MHDSIFKAYDIRGIYGKEVNEKDSYLIGKAFADFLGKKSVVVGIDMRDSSKPLFKELVKGLNEQGADVIEIGLCSTPMFYFAVNYLKADGGIMVTASHNPSQYNGFKFTKEKAMPVSYDDGIKKIQEIAVSGKFKKSDKKGSLVKKEIIHEYANFVLSLSGHIPKLKAVVDTSNGMAGLEIPVIFPHLDIEIIHINKELDGNFPNHEANPLKEEAYKQLIKELKKQKADFGAMFDGDADRVGFIDENGKIITSDMITALLASKYSGEKILYDLRSSWVVKEEAEKAGNKAIISRVGHSFIKASMRKENVVFAGELSGHYYYRDHFFTESSILTFVKVAQIIAKEKKKLSELIKPLKRYYQSGEINSEVDDKDRIFKNLEEKYQDGKILKIDGLSIEYKDWWFNTRASNTEPLLRLNLEAKTEKLMKKKLKEVLSLIRG